MGFKNTLRSGSVRNIIFQDGKEWFGAALEFNIVESGDSPQEVMILLNEAVRGYVEAAKKSKVSISVLNQEVDPALEKLWSSSKKTSGNSDQGKKRVYSTSSQSISALTYA